MYFRSCSLFVTYKSHHFIQFVIFFPPEIKKRTKWSYYLFPLISNLLEITEKLDYFFKLKNKPEKTCKVRCIFY